MKIIILFLLYKSKINSKGLCPIRCRITFLKKRKEFSTGLFVNPEYWNSKKQKVEKSRDSNYTNNQLSLIQSKLNQAFLFLQVNQSNFTVDEIYSKYLGEKPKRELGVIEVYELHSRRIEKLIGKEIQLVTYKKYKESGVHLNTFIKHKFKAKDIQIKSLKDNFLDEYIYYLKTEKNLQQSTINKAIQRFRRVIKYAISEDWLVKDPFILYKPKSIKKEVVFLSRKELKRIEEYPFTIERVKRVRDMFVFCCYTGLGFKEMTNLKKEDIVNEYGDGLWIKIYRNKTNRTYKVPLLQKAKVILDTYGNESSEYVLPKMHNQNFNAFLKEIAAVTGLKKNLTHHVARKTFATTVLLYNDVPMEVVSKLLGHSKIQTTQDHYGEILQKKVGEEMKRITKILKDK